MEYKFVRIDPSSPDLRSQVMSYKELRLKALQLSPETFSSTYAIESKFSDKFWLSRFQDVKRHTFICIATCDGLEESVGHVTVLGPVSAEDYSLPSESGQPAPALDSEEEKWQMLSLYTLPDHRGKSLAKQLCQYAFDFLTSRKGETPHILLRIMARSDNSRAIALYNKLGFRHSGNCTLAEALRANGDGDLIPKGQLGPEFIGRNGTIMSQRMKRVHQ